MKKLLVLVSVLFLSSCSIEPSSNMEPNALLNSSFTTFSDSYKPAISIPPGNATYANLVYHFNSFANYRNAFYHPNEKNGIAFTYAIFELKPIYAQEFYISTTIVSSYIDEFNQSSSVLFVPNSKVSTKIDSSGNTIDSVELNYYEKSFNGLSVAALKISGAAFTDGLEIDVSKLTFTDRKIFYNDFLLANCWGGTDGLEDMISNCVIVKKVYSQ